jgi:hypothetical protein
LAESGAPDFPAMSTSATVEMEKLPGHPFEILLEFCPQASLKINI